MLIVTVLLILAAGLAAGWPWLVTAGLAPILLALAPCAAICALGVCMSKVGGKECTSSNAGATSAGKPIGQNPRKESGLHCNHERS